MQCEGCSARQCEVSPPHENEIFRAFGADWPSWNDSNACAMYCLKLNSQNGTSPEPFASNLARSGFSIVNIARVDGRFLLNVHIQPFRVACLR